MPFPCYKDISRITFLGSEKKRYCTEMCAMWICYCGVPSYLDSILPHPNILLSQFEPPHGALSMSQVVLPLPRVSVTRGVAVKTQILSFRSLHATVVNMKPCSAYIPSCSPSLSVVLHPISFVPRCLLTLFKIHHTLTKREPITEEKS